MAEKSFNLAGKDWFREEEAAEYCGVCERQFQRGVRELVATGRVRPREVFGRKLYSRVELHRMIESAPEWRRTADVDRAPEMVERPLTSGAREFVPNLSSVRLRPYRPRKPRR